METVLYYFSGSGNSLAVARDLARELGGAEVVPIASLPDGEVEAAADRVGLVFPVYVWGLPLIVAGFAKRLKVREGAYVFAVATYGSLLGAALPQLRRLLRRKGVRLSAGFGVRMPGNYIPLAEAPAADRQELLLARGRERVRHIATSVGEGLRRRAERSFFLLNWFFSGVLHRIAAPVIPDMDRSFRAEESCTRCGRCAQVCPVGNIVLKDGVPEWRHRCQQCFACLHWCPVQAIQFGKKTPGRRRYVHPEVTVDDFTGGGPNGGPREQG